MSITKSKPEFVERRTSEVILLHAHHLLHEDDPLDSLQHHEQWGVCLTTGFVQLFEAYGHHGWDWKLYQ